MMSFEEWLNFNFYEGFAEDANSGLTDEEYYELEDAYYAEVEKVPVEN